jgi:hypothetical protein
MTDMTAIDIDDTRTQIIARIPAPDETGGLDLFVDMLWSKKSATGEYQIIEPKTEADAHALAQPVQSKSPGLFRRTLGRVKAAISKAVATVREATQWLFHDVPNPHLIQRFRNRFFGYKGKHHTAAAWYGRQRSTSAAVVITRERRMRAQQTSRTKEGVLSSYFPLPEYWVSHMVGLIETIREEHSIFHPSTGRHWECS